jgi:hypothetical protein
VTEPTRTNARAGSRWRPGSARDALLLAGAVALGAIWRLPDVERAFLFGDELHTLFDVPRGYGYVIGHFSATGAGMALPLLQRVLLDLFGAGHWTIRAPAWLPGLVLLPATWWVARRWLGDRVALAATWGVAVCPLLVFYAHFARAYALVALLTLLLLDRVQASVEEARVGAARFAAITAFVAILPWVHPTALGSVVPVVLAGALAVFLRPEVEHTAKRRTAGALLGTLVAGGIVCLGLHVPAATSLQAFVAAKTTERYTGDFGPLDVATLLAGDRSVAIVLLLSALGGAASLARTCGARALPLLAAAFAPFAVIAGVRPYGDAYAYARYGIAAVPPLLALVAWTIERAARMLPERSAPPPTAWIAAAGALVWLAVGPPGPLREPAPQHANTYLGLLALPAFDAPWPRTPAFYRTLAERPAGERAATTLIEVPALTTRSRHLYRHYQLQHGARTLLGPLPGEFPMLPRGPYVAIGRIDAIASSGADYVVVHRDVATELARYWAWIYGPEGPPADPDRAAYLARHARYGGLLPAAPAGLLAALARKFGEPVYEDETLVVFDVASAASGPPDAAN